MTHSSTSFIRVSPSSPFQLHLFKKETIIMKKKNYFFQPFGGGSGLVDSMRDFSDGSFPLFSSRFLRYNQTTRVTFFEVCWNWTRLGRIIWWTRYPNGFQGGGTEPGTKVVDQIRLFPTPREIPIYVFLFFQTWIFSTDKLFKGIISVGIRSYDKRILGGFMSTFFPNPLRELFRRLRRVGRRKREGRDR